MQKGNSREEMAVAVQFTPEETQWWLDRLRIPKSVERFAANQFRHRAEVMRFVTEAGLVATRLFFRFAPRRQFDITDPRSTVGVVKKWCRDAGIGAATWKWLLHQQPEKPVSKKAIKNEGIVMRHCLEHNSGETARRGQSIYFALTSGGKRTGRKDPHRATLEIAMNHEGQWRKRQLYGFGNKAVPEVVHTAADNLLAKINNQELLLNQDMEMSNTMTM